MRATVRQFTAAGDTILMEYDTETADMAEVNQAIASLEASTGGKAFDYQTGEALDGRITKEQTDVLLVTPICGG